MQHFQQVKHSELWRVKVLDKWAASDKTERVTEAHRCILLLHVIFVLLLETGSQIALHRNYRGREEMDTSAESPTLGTKMAAQQTCPKKKKIIYRPKKKQPKNKSWSHWNILFDFWFTRSGTSSMISIACMYAPSLSWGVFVFNKIPSLHHLSNKRKKKRKRFKLPDGTQVKQQSSSYTHWLVTCQRVCGDRLKITVENWQQLIGG